MPGLFVAGHGSGAGKSTVCLALMQHAITAKADGGLGLAPSDIAYIKPATQCETPTDVSMWCDRRGITSIGVGPVVFRAGFTASIIGLPDSELHDREAALLASVTEAVSALLESRQFVLVDGVGYPSVGSCVGLGNAAIAARLRLPVLLVGTPGLGDCIDTFELMITYFAAKGARVAAAVVNRSVDTERHKVQDTLPLIERTFARKFSSVAFCGAAPVVTRSTETLDPDAYAPMIYEAFRDKTTLFEFACRMMA